MSDKDISADRLEAIRLKVAAGLSRQQAEEAQDNQEAHDASLEKAEKAAAKKAPKANGKPEDEKPEGAK